MLSHFTPLQQVPENCPRIMCPWAHVSMELGCVGILYSHAIIFKGVILSVLQR